MQPLSQTAEDYLKEIHRLESEHGRATTSALAASLGVSPPSVTSMLKKLATLKLVVHEPYRGAKLTSAGRKAASRGDPPSPAARAVPRRDARACRSTRCTRRPTGSSTRSPRSWRRGSTTLGFPTHDPHGDPIPDADLQRRRRRAAAARTRSVRESARRCAACPTTRRCSAICAGSGCCPARSSSSCAARRSPSR